MSAIEHAAESPEKRLGTGRITPLNMASETKGLNYDSLLLDMTAANDPAQQHFDCSFWA